LDIIGVVVLLTGVLLLVDNVSGAGREEVEDVSLVIAGLGIRS